jgi:hypothetical protein
MFTPRAVLLLTAAKLPHHHGEHILNKFLDALKVDSGGSASDEAVTRPCLVALSCLTPDFYEHLHVSVQVCCSATQAPWHSRILTLNPKPRKLFFGQNRSVRLQRVSRHRVHE